MFVTQQGEAEARGRAEPCKEGQRQHTGFRVRADREGEDTGAKASKMGLWGPGSSALLPGRDGQPWKGVNEKAPALQLEKECHTTASVWKHDRVLLDPQQDSSFQTLQGRKCLEGPSGSLLRKRGSRGEFGHSWLAVGSPASH